MSALAYKITCVSIICSTVSLDADERKQQSSVWGDPPVTGGFPSQRASNAENISIWRRHNAARSNQWRINIVVCVFQGLALDHFRVRDMSNPVNKWTWRGIEEQII